MSLCKGTFINRAFINGIKFAAARAFYTVAQQLSHYVVSTQELVIAVIFCGKVYSIKVKTFGNFLLWKEVLVL